MEMSEAEAIRRKEMKEALTKAIVVEVVRSG